MIKIVSNLRLHLYILNSFNPALQLNGTESAIKNELINSLTKLKGFKFVTTPVLVINWKMKSDNKRKYNMFYWHSTAETILTESDTNYVFESIYTTVISIIHIFRKGFKLDYSFSRRA